MGITIRSDKVGRESQMAGEKWSIFPDLGGGREVEVELELVIFIQRLEEIFSPFFLSRFNFLL